jgi:hypothetical protein
MKIYKIMSEKSNNFKPVVVDAAVVGVFVVDGGTVVFVVGISVVSIHQ